MPGNPRESGRLMMIALIGGLFVAGTLYFLITEWGDSVPEDRSVPYEPTEALRYAEDYYLYIQIDPTQLDRGILLDMLKANRELYNSINTSAPGGPEVQLMLDDQHDVIEWHLEFYVRYGQGHEQLYNRYYDDVTENTILTGMRSGEQALINLIEQLEEHESQLGEWSTHNIVIISNNPEEQHRLKIRLSEWGARHAAAVDSQHNYASFFDNMPIPGLTNLPEVEQYLERQINAIADNQYAIATETVLVTEQMTEMDALAIWLAHAKQLGGVNAKLEVYDELGTIVMCAKSTINNQIQKWCSDHVTAEPILIITEHDVKNNTHGLSVYAGFDFGGLSGGNFLIRNTADVTYKDVKIQLFGSNNRLITEQMKPELRANSATELIPYEQYTGVAKLVISGPNLDEPVEVVGLNYDLVGFLF